ncbi:MAG: hypothetical protein K0Q46_2707 [Rhodococcus erythropolis]|jgi:hypothetical protein|nr:hypothetical protein [Rhodococcus erythropolis]MDF2895921.1 hypothetical protein [Rhodococcus erythropolis]
MASRIIRRQCFSGLPSRPAELPGGGSNGSRIAHWASVSDDDGYIAQQCPRDGWGGHDEHSEIGDGGIRGRLGTCSDIGNH